MLSGINVSDIVLLATLVVVGVLALYAIGDAFIRDHFRRYESAYNARFCKQYKVSFRSMNKVSFRSMNRSYELEGPGVHITGNVFKLYRIVRKMYRNRITREHLEQISDTPYSKLPI